MKSFALPLMLLVGCASDQDDFPVEPNGMEGTPPINGNTGETFRARICVSDSIVDLTRCRSGGLAGFTVKLGSRSTTTDATGAFELPAPTGTTTTPPFTVSGPGAVTTTTPFSPSLTLPVIDADVYARTMASNQIFASTGTGAILGNVTRSGNAASDVVVTSNPTGSFMPLFDTDGTGFGTNATGARGVFWLPGIATGGANLTFSDVGGETTVAGVQVVNGGVTILDSVVLP